MNTMKYQGNNNIVNIGNVWQKCNDRLPTFVIESFSALRIAENFR